MDRIADICVSLPLTAGASVTFADTIELSLDCHVCRRFHRTVRLSKAESKGRCFPTKHPFPGRVIAKEISHDKRLTTVKYRVRFESESFKDKKFPKAPKPSGELSWARVSFKITCLACGERSAYETQNNLVRPIDCTCECGQLLYMEKNEMPVFSWVDNDAH